MFRFFRLWLGLLAHCFRSHRTLLLENLALRQQLARPWVAVHFPHTNRKLGPCLRGVASGWLLSLLRCSACALFSYVLSAILAKERLLHFQLRQDMGMWEAWGLHFPRKREIPVLGCGDSPISPPQRRSQAPGDPGGVTPFGINQP
jgi:hypothetical protein